MQYPISELVDIVGAPKRALIHWAETGVIKADPATDRGGSGVHRLFDRDEVIIACIINVLVKQMSSVGYLIRVANSLRHCLDDRMHAQDASGWRFHIERAIKNKGSNLILFITQDKNVIINTVLQTDYEGAPENFKRSIALAMQNALLANVVSLNAAFASMRANKV